MKALKILSTLVLAALLFSFIAPGGEHFEISVNGNRVIRCFVYEKKPTEWLVLDKSAKGNVSVMYNHCGQTSKGRKLAVIDAKNVVLKEWKFENATGAATGKNQMNVGAGEIASLITKSTSQLNLFYSSEDLPEGRVLAHLKMEGSSMAGTE